MKVRDLTILDVKKLTSVADKMVICSGNSSRHCRSIANNLLVESKKAGNPPMGVEGMNEGQWVLIDMNEIIVHIMDDKSRDFYQLEKLWSGESKHLNK